MGWTGSKYKVAEELVQKRRDSFDDVGVDVRII